MLIQINQEDLFIMLIASLYLNHIAQTNVNSAMLSSLLVNVKSCFNGKVLKKKICLLTLKYFFYNPDQSDQAI